MSKLGRNDPCPCGSGKKYKKCCLPQEHPRRSWNGAVGGEEDFIAVLRPDVDEAVDRVLEKLESGAGQAVEPEIKALLKQHPDYHKTQFAMGTYLATVVKDFAGSIPFFERAVQIFPPFPEAYFNLAS